MTIPQALEKIGQLLKGEMGKSIQSQTSGTGALERSIKYEVKQTPTGYDLIRGMYKYGDYVDSGVKGTETKYNSNPKSIYPQGQFKKPIISKQSGLPYPVRIAIARRGLKPKPFIGTSISQIMTHQGQDILMEAGLSEIKVMVGRELTDITLG